MARSGFVVPLSSAVRSIGERNSLAVVLCGVGKLLLPILLLGLGLNTSVTAQTGNGITPLETMDREVAVDNLNVHLEIPIVSKSGIGLPFAAHLYLNNNFWTYSGGGWSPGNIYGGQPGWSLSTSAQVFYPVTQVHTCIPSPLKQEQQTLGITDGFGNYHPLPGFVFLQSTAGTVGSCDNVTSYTHLLSDNSGLTVTVAENPATNSLVDPDGTSVTISSSGSSVTWNTTDVHGNVISVTDTPPSISVKDTLDVAELTSSGGLDALCTSAGSPTITYPTSTGTATVTLNCSAVTLQANFGTGCTSNYGPATAYLLASINMPDGSTYTFTYEATPCFPGSTTGRLASITYPSGEEVQYSYGAMGGDFYPLSLTKTVANDGVYTYTRVLDLGVSEVVTEVGPAPANNNTVYYFYESAGGGGDYFLTQKIYNQGTSTPLKTEIYCYNNESQTPSACATSTGSAIMPATQIDTYTQFGGMSNYSRTTQMTDAYMNTTKVVQYDFGATTPTRQTVFGPYGYTWNGSTSSPTCTTLIGSGISNKPCQVQLQNGSGAQLRNTYFQYGTTTNPGSLLSQAILTGGSTYLTTSATYNPNGTIATTTDANGNITTYTQGACGGPTKVVPAISTLDVQFTWDSGCNGAKVLSATDPNGFSVSATYNDPFWRPNSSTDQLGNTASLSYYPNVPINTNEAQMTFGSSDFDVFNTSDPLGRPLYAQRIENSGGTWDTTQMGYSWNTSGRVITRTMPCSTSKGTGCSNGTTTITHDAIGRTLVKTDGGGGTVTTTDTGFSSGCGSSLLGCVDILTVVGPAPAGEVVKQVQNEYNGLGQLMSTCQLSSATGTTSCGQANGGTGYLTTYNYNADGTVSSIVRGSQTHSFTYDALGRTLTAAYPESGTKYFYYDSAPSTPGVACSTTALPTGTGLNVSPLGHLVKTYDSNGTTTCLSYDKMNRNTGIAYAGTNWDGENKYFTYDSATVDGATMLNTLGRVAEAYTAPTAAGTKATDEGFSYTARGEISDVYQSTPNSNGYYHTTATYFANHALNTLSGVLGASGSPWTYSLDGKGRPYSAIESPSSNMVSSTTYNAADEPCVVTLGYGDTDTYLHDNNTSCSGTLVTGRMTSYTFSIGATPTTFAGSLTWNANGSLRGLATVDGINSGSETETCAYGTSSSTGYDEFGRLLQVNCVNGSTNVWNQTFSYDMYNNVTKSVPSGGTGVTWAPGYSATNNQYTLSGTSYDSNGNLLTDTFHTYTWNQDNHPLAMTDSGITMVYDAFGRMVEKATGSTYQQTLISPIGPVALMAKQNLVQYRMPLPGGDIDVTGINFYHKDYLGSVPLVSSRGGRASVAARLFAPYGESYNNDGIAGDLNFSGDYQDLVAGTYDTPNRELNPSQGRWISPDPAHSGWNAYSYTTNPLAETDPSGLYINTWSYCKNTATCNADDGGNGGGGGGSGASQASLAGFGDSYYIDGMQVSGMVAGSLLGMDAAAVCPSSCSGFSNTGQYVQYVASAGLGAQGYVNFSDLTQGLYDDNGTFYTPSQWNTYQNQISLAQELGQYNRLSANLPDGGSIPPFNTNIPVVDGGHANFPYTCQAGFNCGPGRYPNGVHVECASGGYNCSAGSPLVAHDDTVSPWTGSFQFQDVFSANFWEHGFIDLFYGQFCNCVFPY